MCQIYGICKVPCILHNYCVWNVSSLFYVKHKYVDRVKEGRGDYITYFIVKSKCYGLSWMMKRSVHVSQLPLMYFGNILNHTFSAKHQNTLWLINNLHEFIWNTLIGSKQTLITVVFKRTNHQLDDLPTETVCTAAGIFNPWPEGCSDGEWWGIDHVHITACFIYLYILFAFYI